jgi:hypothetical protein
MFFAENLVGLERVPRKEWVILLEAALSQAGSDSSALGEWVHVG